MSLKVCMWRELILLQLAWRGISALLDDDAKSCRILSTNDHSDRVVHSGPWWQMASEAKDLVTFHLSSPSWAFTPLEQFGTEILFSP